MVRCHREHCQQNKASVADWPGVLLCNQCHCVGSGQRSAGGVWRVWASCLLQEERTWNLPIC